MPVGSTALTFYEQEDIAPRFTVTDTRVTDVTGWTATFVIKDGPEDAYLPLHTAAAAVIAPGPPATLILEVATKLPITLGPGTYVYGLRRTNVGFDWQLAHGALTILDSANKVFTP